MVLMGLGRVVVELLDDLVRVNLDICGQSCIEKCDGSDLTWRARDMMTDSYAIRLSES